MFCSWGALSVRFGMHWWHPSHHMPSSVLLSYLAEVGGLHELRGAPLRVLVYSLSEGHDRYWWLTHSWLCGGSAQLWRGRRVTGVGTTAHHSAVTPCAHAPYVPTDDCTLTAELMGRNPRWLRLVGTNSPAIPWAQYRPPLGPFPSPMSDMMLLDLPIWQCYDDCKYGKRKEYIYQ